MAVKLKGLEPRTRCAPDAGTDQGGCPAAGVTSLKVADMIAGKVPAASPLR